MLLLANWKQGKPALCCRYQSTRPVIYLLPPPLPSLIPWKRRLPSTYISVVVVLVFVLIFLLWRLRLCRRFLGTGVYLLPSLSLSPIPQSRHVYLVLYRRLRHRRWVLWTVLLFRIRRCRHKYPLTVNTPAPPPSETFTQTRCILYFLNWRLRCCCR